MSATPHPHARTWTGWTEADDARLRAWYALPRSARPTQARLGQELGGRSANALTHRAQLLGLTRCGGRRVLAALEAAGRPLTTPEVRRALGLERRPWATLEALEAIGAVTVVRRRGGNSGNLYSLAVARRGPGPGRMGP